MARPLAGNRPISIIDQGPSTVLLHRNEHRVKKILVHISVLHCINLYILLAMRKDKSKEI